MRTVSAQARAAFYAQSSGYSLPILLEITHGVSGIANPLLIVNNTVNLTYNSKVYSAFPFKFDPPNVSNSGELSNAKLSICAVDQQIAYILRSTSTPPTIKAVAMFFNNEGSMIFEPIASWEFILRNVQGTADIISADLIYEDRLDYEFPVGEFRPTDFPGLF